MIRRLILLAWLALALLIALPFVMTSRALEEHGVTIPGSVYHKSEYAKTVYSNWELSRKITIEFTIPETSSVSFFDIYPSAERYDSLHTKQAVDVRYLPRKDVPDVPGAKILWEIHALPTARVANMDGVSRMDSLRTPRFNLICEILGSIIVLIILRRITHWRSFAWAAGGFGAWLFALMILDGFPKPTPAPSREVRQASGRVTNIGRIDKLLSGSRSRGMIADQPVDVVSVEFVPEGRTEPVVAVDLIDRGSVPGLKEQATVTLDYESRTPRIAYIAGATRSFPERNFSGAVMGGVLFLVVIGGLLGVIYLFGRGYDRLVKGSR